jgi:GAF domain-containing protein
VLTDQHLKLLETFADQAVIAIENARLFSELQERNGALAEALEQQTATAEVLAAISRAPTDLQQVLSTIAASASRLCGGADCGVLRVEGDALLPVAATAGSPAVVERDPSLLQTPALVCGRVGGRAVLERRTLHVADVRAEAEEYPDSAATSYRTGARTILAVPLLRGDGAMGALYLTRTEVAPFTDAQVALVKTFADQAVIAIENARLFAELQERLAEQTATAEVLKSISHAPTDLQRVLDTITASAMRLCEGTGASLAYGPATEVRILSSAGTAGDMTPVGLTIPVDGPGPVRRVYATGELFHSGDVVHDERLPEGFRRVCA